MIVKKLANKGVKLFYVHVEENFEAIVQNPVMHFGNGVPYCQVGHQNGAC